MEQLIIKLLRMNGLKLQILNNATKKESLNLVYSKLRDSFCLVIKTSLRCGNASLKLLIFV